MFRKVILLILLFATNLFSRNGDIFKYNGQNKLIEIETKGYYAGTKGYGNNLGNSLGFAGTAITFADALNKIPDEVWYSFAKTPNFGLGTALLGFGLEDGNRIYERNERQ